MATAVASREMIRDPTSELIVLPRPAIKLGRGDVLLIPQNDFLNGLGLYPGRYLVWDWIAGSRNTLIQPIGKAFPTEIIKDYIERGVIRHIKRG